MSNGRGDFPRAVADNIPITLKIFNAAEFLAGFYKALRTSSALFDWLRVTGIGDLFFIQREH